MVGEAGRGFGTIVQWSRRHRARVLRAACISVLLAGLGPLLAQQISSQQNSKKTEVNVADLVRLRAQWFFRQRALANGHVPGALLLAAFAQNKKMIAAEGTFADRLRLREGAAAPAQNSWTPVGPQPTANTMFSGYARIRRNDSYDEHIGAGDGERARFRPAGAACIFGERGARVAMARVGDALWGVNFRRSDEFREAPTRMDCHLLRERDGSAKCDGGLRRIGWRWREPWAHVCHHHHWSAWELSTLDLRATRGRLALLETPVVA